MPSGQSASMIMLADESPEQNARGPKARGFSPVGLRLFVANVDAAVARAIKAGATLLCPVADRPVLRRPQRVFQGLLWSRLARHDAYRGRRAR